MAESGWVTIKPAGHSIRDYILAALSSPLTSFSYFRKDAFRSVLDRQKCDSRQAENFASSFQRDSEAGNSRLLEFLLSGARLLKLCYP